MRLSRLPSILAAVACGLCLPSPDAVAADRPSAQVLKVSGAVTGRPPKAEAYGRLSDGDRVPYGSRVKTGDDGQVTLQFVDGTKVQVRPKTEVMVRPRPKDEASGVVLFFGRVWSKVVKSVGGETSFEVESANAVAGVRGTQFEVGVADDGSTRVIVTEGQVAVEGDAAANTVPISAGFEIESNGMGRLAKRRKAKRNPNWDGWFTKRAKTLERKGLKVARHLEGRLDKRRAKVVKLVEEQRELRRQIEALEARRRAGEDVGEALQAKLDRMEQVTERLESMKDRLQAAFGMFERWGQVAERGAMQGGAELTELVQDVQKVAVEFADMVEEGTDLSEEGMDDMMDGMKKGSTLKPDKGVKNDLF